MEFLRSETGRRIGLMLGIAISVAIMVGIWLWSQKPDYRVLFSNFSDKDGGAIVAVLEQMNVPYKFSDGGTAILVPSDQVNDLRLKLAAQDLPKGGNVGFEVMENQKLGTSQFLEQINYQRALEGELASTIESISAVQAARVHLALPKNSVFVRDQQKPTASVLINLQPGRALDPAQVTAIVHLLASSVPSLTPDNVTIVDQNGNLLSSDSKPNQDGLDPQQLKYVQTLQQDIASRIEAIISPIVGANNVHAEVTADVDFSHNEQAAETYKPNPTPDTSSVRSRQTDETTGADTSATGIPGALSNQPPAPATAPINAPAAPAGVAATGSTATTGTTPAPAANTLPSHKSADTRYELNKTLRYTQDAIGGIKRLSVAVVVNDKTVTDKLGKTHQVPLSSTEKAQINDLAKEAMGFDASRGDTLNVANSAFVTTTETLPVIPWWKQPETIEMAKTAGRYLLAFIALLIVYRKVLKPLLEKLNHTNKEEAQHPEHAGTHNAQAHEPGDDSTVVLSAEAEAQAAADHQYLSELEGVRQIARDNPKIVANVVKTWINGNE